MPHDSPATSSDSLEQVSRATFCFHRVLSDILIDKSEMLMSYSAKELADIWLQTQQQIMSATTPNYTEMNELVKYAKSEH